MNGTTENFWEAWNNFEWPNPAPVFYRAYSRDDGTVFFSMENLPGHYIEIDLETYRNGDINTKIVDGKIVKVIPAAQTSRLKPNAKDGFPCHPSNVSIIVDNSVPYTLWGLENTNDS